MNRKNGIRLKDVLILVLLIFLSLLTENTHNTIKLFGWLNIILFAYYTVSIKGKHSFLSIYFIFLFFSVFFHFGQIFTNSLGLGSLISESIISANVLQDRSLNTVVHSIKFCTLSIFLFNMGAQYIFNTRYKDEEVDETILLEREKSGLKVSRITGLIVLIISSYFIYKFDSAYIIQGMTNGYIGIRQLDVNYGITDDMARLFKVGMILLIIGYKDKKSIFVILVLSNISYSLLKVAVTGLRGYEIIYLVILVYIYYKVYKNLSLAKLSLLLTSGIVLLTLSSLTVLYRESTRSFNLSNVWDFLINRNPIISSINEFGSTLITTQLFIDFVPQTIDYGYGKSYVYSLVTLLPNINGFLNDIVQSAYPNVILARHFPGIGGSFIGELYYNFGDFGVFVSAFIGGAIALLSLAAEKALKRKEFFKFGLYAIAFNTILWTVRDSLSTIPRNLMFALLVPVVIKVFIDASKKSHVRR
ncbi:O-antigen polysaccharide polymerase Wzy [Paenibacillus sp. SYP-B4298]|uniref:O-antigen polysaccharide polymerase Wzy n=1 Tax=Paenibacillus sp. SYP-B4298 TaxID=2996034 RepID=UPI0022DE24DD|nr:O-antigen polysaccharide polymerase Wzy [Paenibacillus sp. SYP-B4298]